MSKVETIQIMFPNGGIIPKAFSKSGKDLNVAPMAGISVPADYGRQLIDDKFAMQFDTSEGGVVVKTEKETKTSAKDKKALADLAEGKKKLTDEQTLLAQAQQVLSAATDKLGSDQEELKTAQEKLVEDSSAFEARMGDELKIVSDKNTELSSALENFEAHVSAETERLEGLRARLADLATLAAAASSEADIKAVAAAADDIQTDLTPQSDEK